MHVNDAVSTNPFGCFVGVGSASDWCEVGNHWVVRMCFASSVDSSWETHFHSSIPQRAIVRPHDEIPTSQAVVSRPFTEDVT